MAQTGGAATLRCTAHTILYCFTVAHDAAFLLQYVHMYSAWALKRRFQYQVGVGIFILSILGIVLAIGLIKPPTCFDGKQNQDEKGVDCAGTCSLRCSFEVQKLTTKWAQAFEVSPGYYNAIAYIENFNLDSYAQSVPYTFLLYDAEGRLILERAGEVNINGEPIVPVFAGGLATGSLKPVIVRLEVPALPAWYRMREEYTTRIEQQRYIPSATVQEIQAELVSVEVIPLSNIEVFAVVYDLEKNAMAASKTLVPFLGPQAKAQLTFTWPQPFPSELGRVELTTHIPHQER